MDHDAHNVAEIYAKRAGIEPQIADVKNHWAGCAMSSSDFRANSAMFVLKLLSHNLLLRYVAERMARVEAGRELCSWRSGWIREALISIPGRMTRSRRITTLTIPTVTVLAHMLN